MSSTINAGTSGLVLTGSTTTTLSLATNGTTRATIDASGNVGIGTATPVQTLEVKSNNAFGQFTIDSAGGQYSQMFFKNNGTAVGSLFTDNSNNFLEVYGYSNVGIRFYTNNSERMRLTSAGDLGLGTTPSFLFDAYNSSTAVDYVAGRFYSAAAASGESRTWLKLEKAVNYGGAVGGYISQGIGSGLLFGTQNNASTPTERMRIDNNGNVGIGTASPAFASGDGLEVQRAADATVRVERTGATASAGEFVASSGLVKIGATSGSPFTFITDNTERMRIDGSTGNVGIGTTTTTNGNLTVQKASSTTDGPVLTLWNSNNNAGNTCGYLRFFSNTTIRAELSSVIDSGPPYAGNFIFKTGEGTLTERMRIDSSGKITDQYGNIRAIPQSGSDKTTSYTLATTDVGRFIGVGSGGSITVPDATFATGDVVSIFNNTTGNVTLTMTITTAYIGGTNTDKATITLATRGVATILFISGTVCVVNGNVS